MSDWSELIRLLTALMSDVSTRSRPLCCSICARLRSILLLDLLRARARETSGSAAHSASGNAATASRRLRRRPMRRAMLGAPAAGYQRSAPALWSVQRILQDAGLFRVMRDEPGNDISPCAYGVS